jgi:hypothetical protein
MKKVLLAALTLLLLSLSACASQPPVTNTSNAAPVAQAADTANTVVDQAPAATPTSAPQAAPTNTVRLNADYDQAVSVEMQLLLGTFKLTGTEQAITKDQAATLVPLWTEFKTFSQSMQPAQGAPGQGQGSTTPQAPTVNPETQTKITALVEQIQAAMTPEQIQAIAELKITQAAAMTIMQEQGIALGGPRQGDGNNPGAGNQPPQGTPPAGDPNGGGQPPADGQKPGGDGRQGGGFIPSELIEALLKTLQS